MFESEEIDIEYAVLEELDGPAFLNVESVVLRDDRIRSKPAMRSKLALFRPLSRASPRSSRGIWQVWQVETESFT